MRASAPLLVLALLLVLAAGCTSGPAPDDSETPGDLSTPTPTPTDVEPTQEPEQSATGDAPAPPTGSEQVETQPDFLQGLGLPSDTETTAYATGLSTAETRTWYTDHATPWTRQDTGEFPTPEGGTVTYTLYRNGDDGALIILTRPPTGPGTLILQTTGPWTRIGDYSPGITMGETPEEEGRSEEEQRLFPDYRYLPVTEEKVKFDRAPIATDDIKAVWPTGTLQSGPGETGHVLPTTCGYLEWKNPESYPPSIEVRAPADGYVVEVSRTELAWPTSSGRSGTYDDYEIRIAISATQFTTIGHVAELSDDLTAKLGTVQHGGNRYEVEVSEGELLGYTGGRPGAQYTMNWRVADLDTRRFVKPEHYSVRALESHFLDHSTPELRNQLLPLVTGTQDPPGGEFDHDVEDTLSGNWFHEDADTDEPSTDYDHQLSFTYDPYDPTDQRISIGGTLTEKGVYAVTDGPEYTDVTPNSGTAIYHLETAPNWQGTLPRTTLIVKHRGNHTIQIQALDDWHDDPQLTDNAHTYTR